MTKRASKRCLLFILLSIFWSAPTFADDGPGISGGTKDRASEFVDVGANEGGDPEPEYLPQEENHGSSKLGYDPHYN